MVAMGISMDGEEAEKDEPDQMILVDIEEGDMVNIVSGAWQDQRRYRAVCEFSEWNSNCRT